MPITRRVLLVLAAACLVAGVAGGLQRLGIALPLGPGPALSHAPLMIGGFLGAVISLERAIAQGSPAALVAPLAAALGALAIVAGADTAGALLLLLAAVVLVSTSVALVRRQPAEHTLLLAVAAMAWATGNAQLLAGVPVPLVVPWWFAFLVLTVAAERLEMSRLMKRRKLARPLFRIAVATLLAGALASGAAPWGNALFGVAMVALAAWLATYDLARRTIGMQGFARYSAWALLTGYAWLAIAGIAWITQAWPDAALLQGVALRDIALHALGVGFVMSMIFAHAPLVVPVVVRLPVRFTALFYLPLALLHASLLLRAGPGTVDLGLRQWSGIATAAALVLFAAILFHAVRRQPKPTAPSFPDPSPGEHA
jgi:hypothetical protein